MCLAAESAAVKKQPSSYPTRDPGCRQAADHSRGPFAVSHAKTGIAYISIINTLVGGGLCTLRVGRYGCDSLSSASYRQRVKSLRFSVMLRIVIILLA